MVEQAYYHELRIINGVADALDLLDVPVCVASSSFPEKLKLGLEMVNLYDRFAPNVISATSVARGKPEPDVFIFAAGWMRVPPKHCLVVEDSTVAVRAGRSGGMQVFGFAGGAHCGPGYRDRLLDAGAELVFDKMTDLPSLVEVARDLVTA